jgi:predicted anti-sigma-YlaC factor YlaD
MNCKKVERFLLRSFDGLLKEEEKNELKKHLERCPLCQAKREEYQSILDALKQKDFPEPKPYFWERLQPKLAETKKYDPASLWKQWALRAIPASLLVVILFAAAIFLFIPAQQEELSESEDLLLRNLAPLQETKILLEEEKVEDKNMMLIFTAMEEINSTGRYLP